MLLLLEQDLLTALCVATDPSIIACACSFMSVCLHVRCSWNVTPKVFVCRAAGHGANGRPDLQG